MERFTYLLNLSNGEVIRFKNKRALKELLVLVEKRLEKKGYLKVFNIDEKQHVYILDSFYIVPADLDPSDDDDDDL